MTLTSKNSTRKTTQPYKWLDYVHCYPNHSVLFVIVGALLDGHVCNHSQIVRALLYLVTADIHYQTLKLFFANFRSHCEVLY